MDSIKEPTLWGLCACVVALGVWNAVLRAEIQRLRDWKHGTIVPYVSELRADLMALSERVKDLERRMDKVNGEARK